MKYPPREMKSGPGNGMKNMESRNEKPVKGNEKCTKE
jgi:hypothetical protein